MRLKLTERSLDALELPEGKAQLVVWDVETTGFGVVIGKSARTFIAEGRVDGAKRRKAIGIAGRVRDDGHPWNVALARQRAKELLGTIAAGIDPNADRKPGAGGPTLREAVDTHLAKMRKRGRADRSIQTFTHETGKYLAEWLDRPIAELTGEVLVELHEQIKRNAAARVGTNPQNAKGAPLANRVIAHVSASWRSLNKKLGGKLGSWNPASAVDRDTIRPKRERIDDDALPAYAATVATMHSPIRRDGLMFALYTGLRHEDVRTVRFEHVDFKARTLRLPDPKGGEGAAFTIPLSPTPFGIVERRRRDNARDLDARISAANWKRSDTPDGYDGGWTFPGIDFDGKIGPIDNLREKRGKNDRFPAEDVHTLRRTWESIAQQEGISELDQHVLSNHSFGSHNVNATYIAQHIGHLATCADKIDAGITRRIKGSSKSAPRSGGKARRHRAA